MRGLLQFTLDLFDALPTPAQPPQARFKSPPKPAPTPVQKAQPAIDLVANLPTAPAVSVEEASGLANFRHPRANRQLQLGSSLVAFELQRGKRRTIGFSVGPEGLAVRAPRWVPLHEIDAALREKSAWILKKLDESRERQARLASARIEWRHGATLEFLGEVLTLQLDPLATGAVLHTHEGPEGRRLELHLGLPAHAAPAQIRDTVQSWLMRQARRLFIERLDHYAPQLGVSWAKLSLSSAGTRWGSANNLGAIRLNWRLIHFRLAIIDYVVVHELSHLRVMDHSPRFWETVREVVPDYAELRGQLKQATVPPWQ